MTKIRAEHLCTQGVRIYPIRQSTFDQVQNNRESRLRQYGLADRARNLGWPYVSVIDDDLGRSGSGVHGLGDAVAGSTQRDEPRVSRRLGRAALVLVPCSCICLPAVCRASSMPCHVRSRRSS